jgi:hypothetical protein
VTCLRPCPALDSVGGSDLLGWCAASINASCAGGLRLSGDCPAKACQLARDRGGDYGRWLPCPRQLAIPPAKSFLCLPRGIADRLGQTFLPQQLLAADPRREPIAPGGLDEHPSSRIVASLRDTALASRAAAGMLGRHQTKIRHELTWIGEARDVTQFSNQRRRGPSAMPRRACSACAIGASDQSGSTAAMWASSRSRRAVAASTVAMQSSSTM